MTYWHTPRRGDKVVNDIDPRHVGTVLSIVPFPCPAYQSEPEMMATVEWPNAIESRIPLAWLRVVQED